MAIITELPTGGHKRTGQKAWELLGLVSPASLKDDHFKVDTLDSRELQSFKWRHELASECALTSS
jgi:hypothetical protein